MFSRLIRNFLNHFKCFCSIKLAFQQKWISACCSIVSSITINDTDKTDKLHHVANMYLIVPVKLGMRGEEGLLTKFPMFHEDRTTSTMFSPCCRKTYWTNLVQFGVHPPYNTPHFLSLNFLPVLMATWTSHKILDSIYKIP